MKKSLGMLTVLLCATPMIYAQADGIAAQKSSDVVMASNSVARGNVIASGSCGKNVNYELYDDYTLRIFGKGAMSNYDYECYAPWGYGSSWYSYIKSVVIEDGVTRIGAYAFYACTSLTEVIIPNSVKSIGTHAFFSCMALTKIVIPNSVTCIGKSAFQDCSSLVEVNIPDGIETIENSVFSGCISLAHIDIPNSVTCIETGAFFDCSSLTELIIPDNVTTLQWAVFCNCDNLEYVKIGKGITAIDDASFGSSPYAKNLVVEITGETPIAYTSDWFGYFFGQRNVTFRVPESTLDYYRNTEGWSIYKDHFWGYGSNSDITSVGKGLSAMKSETVYDMQGRKVVEMQPNRIYIVNGKKVRK